MSAVVRAAPVRGPLARGLLGLTWTWVFVVVLLPMLSLLWAGLRAPGPIAAALVRPDVLYSLGLTVVITLLTVAFTLVFGAAGGIVLVRGRLPGRLLRVLQDGTFERVGGQRALRADVRVIAATHRDMPRLIAEGRFREDLWYRVAVFPITLPSLRDRMEDLSELTAHFATRAGRRLRGAPLHPTPDDIALLSTYDWPGNVRELAAVVERAAILGDGRRLDVARALGGGLPRAPQRPAPSAAPGPAPTQAPPSAPLSGSFEDIARAAILDALKAAGGQIQGPGGAAERLRINPSTLRSRMERLGVEWRKGR